MNNKMHFKYGYITQITSLITLACINIVLPNYFGTKLFSEYNEIFGFVAFSCILFNEAVSVLIVKKIHFFNHKKNNWIFVLRGIYEHTLLAILSIIFIISFLIVFNPLHHYGVYEWIIVLISSIIIASYIGLMSWFSASYQNDKIWVLSIIQGISSFAFPFFLVKFGLDIKFGVMLSYFTGLMLAAYWFISKVQGSIKLKEILQESSICFNGNFISLVLQSALKLTIIWIPVLLLTSKNDLHESSIYKIGISIAFGICALVPYNKITIISISSMQDKRLIIDIGAFAIIFVCFGILLLDLVSVQLVNLIYRQEYWDLAAMLPFFGIFSLMQIYFDIKYTSLVSIGSMKILGKTYFLTIISAVIFYWIFSSIYATLISCVIFAILLRVFSSAQETDNYIDNIAIYCFVLCVVAAFFGAVGALISIGILGASVFIIHRMKETFINMSHLLFKLKS